MENIDIKDFQSVSAASDLDSILLVRSTDMHGKITVALFRAAIQDGITPSIQDGVWWIGRLNTQVVAEGKTPTFRKGATGIEWTYTNDTDWKLLVEYEDIRLTYDDLTPEQKQAIKGEKGDKGDPFVYSDFTAEQLEALRGPIGKTGDTGATGEKGDKGNVLFATFKINPQTGLLSMRTDEEFKGMEFKINNGKLSVII